MKHLISIVLCLVYLQASSRDRKVLTLSDLTKDNHFSLEFDFGGGKSFQTIDTGFDVDNGSDAAFYPSSGVLVRFAANYFHGERFTYGIAYAFQSGGLNYLYENGDGNNDRTIITPSVRYAPLLFKKGKLNLGIGLNAVLSNYLKITAKQPDEIQSARYDFKKNLGPTIFVEYQEDINDWLGGRIGLSYNYFNYELSSFTYNNTSLDSTFAPYEMQEHSASSLDLYIGLYVYF